MKILQVFDLLSPEHGGGVVALVNQLSKALAVRGHDVTIYTSDYQWEAKYAGDLPGVGIRTFPCESRLASFYYTPAINDSARRELAGFDIIHLNTYRSYQNIVVRRYARKYGVPYVLEAHGSAPRLAGGKGPKRLLKGLFDITSGRRILGDASRLIAQTGLETGEYIALGAEKGKITVLSPPFDTDQFSRLPPEGRFREKYGVGEKHIVLFLGRLNWIKGLDFLVESFHRLCRQRDDVLLAVVGPDDGYKKRLVGLIDRLGLSDKILFTGFLGGEEKLAALVDADTLVQTSRYERGARSPFEAVLCNTPIIVSRDTGAGEEVGRLDAGYLVAYGDRDGLVEAIQHILDNPAEVAGKTSRAREYIMKNLSLAAGVAAYERLYQSVIEERSR